MTGLAMMVKAFGIKITDENLRMIEALIPQIPGKVNEFVTVFNAALEDNKKRMTEIEAKLERIEGTLQHGTNRSTADLDTSTNGDTNRVKRRSANGSR
jgi:hypothetical protein